MGFAPIIKPFKAEMFSGLEVASHKIQSAHSGTGHPARSWNAAYKNHIGPFGERALQLCSHHRIRVHGGGPPGGDEGRDRVGDDGEKEKSHHLGGIDKGHESELWVQDRPAF